MKVDLQIPESWAEVGEKYRQLLAIPNDAKVAVQAYLGVNHALWEILQALKETYPHRNGLAYDGTAGPEFEPIAIALAKEEFNTHALTPADGAAPAAWVAGAQKDTLAVLGAYDDPATGEIQLHVGLQEALNNTRVFQIKISHSYHLHFALPLPTAYEINIISLRPGLAIGILGERAKVEPAIASALDWSALTSDPVASGKSVSEIETLSFAAFEFAADPQAKDLIKDFEKSLPSGARLPKLSERRLFDRSLIIYDDVEGLSMIEALKAELAFDGTAKLIDTLSLCRWKDSRTFDWLKAKGFAAKDLRGTLVISAELIAKHGVTDLRRALELAHTSVCKRQQI